MVDIFHLVFDPYLTFEIGNGKEVRFSLRQRLAQLDKGYVVVIAICLLALLPFLVNASLPQETDAELHIFRLAELSYLIRGGEFYPRWAPNFYHGYGYPIFNYYAPLSYYVALLFEFLPEVDAVTAVKMTFMLGMVLGSLGMYGFVRDNWGRPAGYVAASVYLYAPYIQYIDPHARGVLPESFSIGIFPLALWAFDRLCRQATAARWITAVFLSAAIILSHNLMAMLFFAILLGWVVWQLVLPKLDAKYIVDRVGRRYLLPALFLGVGMAAFFWLPVALERNEVNLNTLIGSQDNYDFRTHFLSVYEMLRMSVPLDWGNTQPVFYFNLGVAQWMLAGIGILMLILRRARQVWHGVFFAITAVALIFMMTPASTFIWEAIPLLPYFQFPWRMLGATSIMLAVLAGIGLDGVLQWENLKLTLIWRSGLIASWVALPLILSLYLTQPAPWPDFGDVFPLRMSLIEQKGRWLGTTSTADYVPATVDSIPRRNEEMVRGFYEGEPLDRVNRYTIPEDAAVVAEELSPLHFQYQVDTQEPFLLRLFLFDFPGWQVRIDGQLVETELGLPEGFIVVPVQAGVHLVDVCFGSTPARTMAWTISLLALSITLIVAYRLRKSERQLVETVSQQDWGLQDKVVLGSVLGLFLLTIFALGPMGILHMSSTGMVAEPAEVGMFANFGDQIALIGADLSETAVSPGDEVEVTLYWKAQQPIDINYQSFVHLLTEEGTLVAQSDHLNPGDFPTKRWPLDKYVLDTHRLVVPADLSSGTYNVKVGLWVQNEGWRLPLFDEVGTQIDDGQMIIQMQIVAE